QSFARRVDHIGLLEVGLRCVQDDRLAALELVVEDPRQPRVCALGHARGVERAAPFVTVVIDVKVLGLDRLEVERPVLDLVLPEVLGRQGEREGEGRSAKERHEQWSTAYGPLHTYLPF